MPDPNAKRDAGRAMMRGLRGRCPACGRGRLLQGYLNPTRRCPSCDANLEPYQTADFAAYIVMFVVGLLATPFVVAATFSGNHGDWIIGAVMAGAIAISLIMLPRAKGAVIGLLWALDIKSNI